MLDTNLVTSCSNVLKVYTIGEKGIDLRVTTTFNDRIVDIIRVPTGHAKNIKDFKAPIAPKQKLPLSKSGKLSRGLRRVVDCDEPE